MLDHVATDAPTRRRLPPPPRSPSEATLRRRGGRREPRRARCARSDPGRRRPVRRRGGRREGGRCARHDHPRSRRSTGDRRKRRDIPRAGRLDVRRVQHPDDAGPAGPDHRAGRVAGRDDDRHAAGRADRADRDLQRGRCGCPARRQVVYHWAYEGGVATGSQISHSYQVPGDYPVAVTVTVTSVLGLSGAASQTTVVVPDSPPSKLQGTGSSNGGGGGSGHGTGSRRRDGVVEGRGRACRKAGPGDPHARRCQPAGDPGARDGVRPTGRRLPADRDRNSVRAGVADHPDGGSANSGGSDRPGGRRRGRRGRRSFALTIAIVTLGALDERRRISLRHA